MLRQIRKLLDLFELLNDKLDGWYMIKEIPYKAILYLAVMKREMSQSDLQMTDCEYRFYLACKYAFLCLPEEVREKMGKIVER